MRLFLGNVFTLNFDENGRCLCPVCGFALNGVDAYNEWSEDATRASDEAAQNASIIRNKEDRCYILASGSSDICPSCKVQFGEDDFLDASDSMSQHEVWSLLRQQWLEKTNIDQAIIDQLIAIGVYINEKGLQMHDDNSF